MKRYIQIFNGWRNEYIISENELQHRFGSIFSNDEIEQLKDGRELIGGDGDLFQLILIE